jgi:hypothetical protein
MLQYTPSQYCSSLVSGEPCMCTYTGRGGAGYARTLLVARTPRKANSPAASQPPPCQPTFPCAPEKPSTRVSGRAKSPGSKIFYSFVEPMTCQFLRGKIKLCEEKRCGGHVYRAITTQPRAQAHGNSAALHRGIGRVGSSRRAQS